MCIQFETINIQTEVEMFEIDFINVQHSSYTRVEKWIPCNVYELE